jgi:murein L,D-transpeptidase YcbB/YkuD
MTGRSSVLAALVGVALTATGCGENPDATAQIRELLGGAPVAASSPADVRSDSADADAAPADSTRGDAATASGPPTGSGAPVITLPNDDTLSIRPSVVALYRDRGYQPAWTDDDEILPRGVSMLEAIAAADSEGLDRERYHFSTAREMARLLNEDAVEDEELEYLANLDLLLTESFARLAQDLAVGTIDPDRAGLDWQIDRGEVQHGQLIARVLEGEDPKEVLASVRPRAPYYARMIAALRQLREVQEGGGWTAVPEGETLEPGAEGPRVAALRARLLAGDDPAETRLARHGQARMSVFDDSLALALEHFQTRHNLQEDGALGPATLAALNVPVDERIDGLRLNLDRWRWLPHDLGDRFILVNVAGYELEVVYDGEAIESMNVVVGQTANRTPIFQDTLEYMVVNPYWNVPASIKNEEIIPAVARDPAYLARNNYEVLYNGEPIGSSVSASTLADGAYRVRQKPGRDNALGNVKFLFPNAQDIYLHDTPADHLFSQKTRAFSHGCIRVERPADLARTLLDRLSERDPGDYDALRSSTGEQWIPFDEKVPVYILYFTAWVNEDGTIRFHEDVYDRDESLEEERREKMAPVEPRPITTAG